MAGKRPVLAVNALLLSLTALAATFQYCGFLLSLLMMQSLRQRELVGAFLIYTTQPHLGGPA